MSSALIVLKQIVTMFILAFVGFALFKKGKISKEGSRTIANLLIYISIPCTIINSFLTERTAEKLTGLGVSVAVGAALLAVSTVIARLIFRKDEIAAFSAAFSNAGFIGIPLITDVLGQAAVFYVAPFIAMLNLLQWTYGVTLLTGKKASVSPKAVVTAPFMVAIIVGLALFLSSLRLPALLGQAIGSMAAVNTPLAMFAVGVYVAQVDFRRMLTRISNYSISLVRLVLIPAVLLLILKLLPDSYADLRMAVFISASCPVGSNVAVYAQLHNKDYSYAVETVVITTILSVAALPLMVYLGNLIW